MRRKDIQEKLKAEAESEVPSAKGLVDVEVRLLEKQDVMNWTAKVLICPEVKEGTTIQIRALTSLTHPALISVKNCLNFLPFQL